jgi:hypothetical protein
VRLRETEVEAAPEQTAGTLAALALAGWPVAVWAMGAKPS